MSNPPGDDDTLVECRACGGHWKLRDQSGKEIMCRWCTHGFMNAKQVVHYEKYRSGPRPKVPSD